MIRAEEWTAALANRAAALGIDRLEEPLVLLVLGPLCLVPLIAAARARRAIPWPAIGEAERAGATHREISPIAAALLRTLALACLALVLAGPRAARELPPEAGLGIDLVLVLDASASMGALEPGAPSPTGEPRRRLDIAREAVRRFADERVWAGDRMALVVFGDSAFTQCPLTSDGALLAAALDRVDVGVAGEATALGDALALAVKRAIAADSAGGQAIVLLTDGRSNAGTIPVNIARALAVERSIRVHTVAIGSGGAEVAVETAAGLRYERHDPDPETLRQIASDTGGRFFGVKRGADLPAVYAAIDALERSPRPLPPRIDERPRPEPLLAAAGGLLLLEIAGARVVRRVLP